MARRSETARRAHRRCRKEQTQKLKQLNTDGQEDSLEARLLQAQIRPPLFSMSAEPTTPQECAARVRTLTRRIMAASTHVRQGVGWKNRRTLKLLEIACHTRGTLLDDLAVASPALRDALCTELNLTP